MKECFYKVFSFFKKIFLFLKLHIRIEARIGSSNKDKEQDDPTEDREKE